MHTPKEIYEWLERIRFYIEDPNSDSKVQLMEYMNDLETYMYDLGQKTDMKMIYDDIYPLTVCIDRYSGIFSGGKFTAWNLDVRDMPWQICGGDDDAMDIFHDIRNGDLNIVYGIGATPDEAVKDLWNKLKKEDK